VTLRLVVVWLALAASATAAVDVDLAAYDEARRRGATGRLEGRLYAERPKPNAPDRPMAGATVVALPLSEDLVRRFQALRDGARDSANSYRDAASLMRQAREAYERELWEAGAAELVRTAVADGDGRFSFEDLPSGRWMLLASHGTPMSVHSPKAQARDRLRYRLPPRLVGYRAETIWLREVAVAPGAPASVELTDRNVWFTGVVEERVLDAGPGR
jgi:hypothetical protein